MTARSCGTCNLSTFTDFDKTPTGRWKKDANAQCNYEIAVPVLPASVLNYAPQGYQKGYVWPDDGAECPVWAPRRETGT